MENIIIKTLILTLLLFMAHTLHSEESHTELLINQIFTLKSEEYTGGLGVKNRVLAKQIRSSMLDEFPVVGCKQPTAMSDLLADNTYQDVDESKLNNETITNKNIKLLVKAMDSESQEVRDTAAYTLSLFGPSIEDILPFIRAKDSDRSIKGNWYSHAFAEIDCYNHQDPNYKRVIPDKLLHNAKSISIFYNKTAPLLINLYKNPNIEYPPEMLSSFPFNHSELTDSKTIIFNKLFEIIINSNLSLNKRIDAVWALNGMTVVLSTFQNNKFVELSTHSNKDLAKAIKYFFISTQHPEGINILKKELQRDNWSWSEDICEYGEKALELETGLIQAIKHNKNRRENLDIIRSLGCIKSKKAINLLLSLAKNNDWEIAFSSINSIGEIGENTKKIRITLNDVIKTTWSKQVRQAAQEALKTIKTGKEIIKNETYISEDGEEMEILQPITIKFGPAAVDHGMPWCNEKGKYSIDNKNWFNVVWNREGLPKAPTGFPEKLISNFDTHTFYKVDDGWLFGSEKGHFDGTFIYWASDKEAYYIADGYTDIYSIFSYNGSILAIGYQLSNDDDSGVLFEIVKENGKWTAKRLMTLPSPPFGYAFGPNNELLFTDGPNDYAVINSEIIPLKCELEVEGSYFD